MTFKFQETSQIIEKYFFIIIICYLLVVRDHNLRKSQEIKDGDEKRSTTPDPRIQRDIDELAKIKDSGVGKSIMKSLERKRDKSPVLDPRSSSRTPSASKEPPYKTRYESPVFACK